MTFWQEIAAALLANLFAGWVFVFFYVLLQWFLQATDVTISYNWNFEGTNFHPTFVIQNRSKSRTYLLVNITYSTNGKDGVWSDNESLWDRELKPGSINRFGGRFDKLAPVKNISSLPECLELQITVSLQTGRKFWLKGQGPGQPSELVMSPIQRAAFRLRDFIEKLAITME